jgi:hypothetical protein
VSAWQDQDVQRAGRAQPAAPGKHGGGLQRGVVHLRVPRHTGTSFIEMDKCIWEWRGMLASGWIIHEQAP